MRRMARVLKLRPKWPRGTKQAPAQLSGEYKQEREMHVMGYWSTAAVVACTSTRDSKR